MAAKNFRDDPAAIAERQRRLAQIAARQGGSSEVPAPSPEAAKFEGRRRLNAACEIGLDRIVPDPDQPRQEFDPEAIARLTESIQARGILQPIRVRWSGELSRYVVVVGERRYRAATAAGLAAIPCIVDERPASAEEILADQLVENCLREDLRPVEQAKAFRTLMDRLGLSQRELAAKLAISQTQVAQAVALLTLPEPIRQEIDAGAIGATVGYHLSKVKDPAEQAELAARAARGEMRRDEVQASSGRPQTRRTWKLEGDSIQITVGERAADPRRFLKAARGLVRLIEAEIRRAAPADAA